MGRQPMSLLRSLFPDMRQRASSERDDSERAASYPPPYPDGWYKLADAVELKNGGVRLVRAWDQRLALFRGDDGKLGLLDAICPHQGANLADGKVRDGCLECPFHEWRFATDGHVAAMPYATAKPAPARAHLAGSRISRDDHRLLLGGPGPWRRRACRPTSWSRSRRWRTMVARGRARSSAAGAHAPHRVRREQRRLSALQAAARADADPVDAVARAAGYRAPPADVVESIPTSPTFATSRTTPCWSWLDARCRRPRRAPASPFSDPAA